MKLQYGTVPCIRLHYIHIYIQTYIHTCLDIPRNIDTYIHPCIHTDIHCITLHCVALHYIHYTTYLHTNIHTYMHRYIHTSPDFRWPLWIWSECTNQAWGAPSAAPAEQIEPEVLQVPHLPRKSSLRCSKRRTRHVKLSQPRRQTSADLWRCSSTAPDAPATQAGPEVLQALRLKTQRRQCVPCRRQASADLYGGAPRLHLPHRTQRRQCAPPASPDFHWPLWMSAAPATRIEPQLLQVLPLMWWG